MNSDWHTLDTANAVSLLGSDAERGLSALEVSRRHKRFGPNALTPRVAETPLQLLGRQFAQPLVYILLAAVVLTMVLREWADAAVILAVVLVNAAIGFFQEMKALRAIDALSRIMESEATVVRDGETRSIPAEEVVPGDVVLLQSGDRVPADLRLLRERDLQIDESALTGESVPVEKNAGELPAATVLADRANMAFSTTLVTYGTGVGLVVDTGDETEIGQINELIASATSLETPLTRQIGSFSHLLLKVILVLAGLVAVAILLRGEPPASVFLAAVALAVGAIPEGLPAVVTATLALGVSRLASRHAIIRKLPAVETLGSTSIICSDKTGTLTQNQMTVRDILAGSDRHAVSGTGYDAEGGFTRDGTDIDASSHDGLIEILRAGLLCNDSRLARSEEGWRVEGDPTEAALLVAAAKAELARDAESERLPRISAVPFESQHQYMATLHRATDHTIVYMKGSVEKLAPRCTEAWGGGTVDPAAIDTCVADMAGEGLRVLAFARATLPADKTDLHHDDLESGLSFLGLQGMIDPPRPEAIEAVATCQRAGVRVKMITGDHVGTAKAIAGQLGLQGETGADRILRGLTGEEIESLDDAALLDCIEDVPVFARATPAQKLRLVEALQSKGHVVAMTGDGVNDAPALRQADIGVAMGITGTEVAKEASDMILTDDNFASIEAAVEEGRGIYDNLIKFIVWTLPTNLAEAGVILVAAFLGLQLPITPLQILWINMTTAILLGATLAFEAKEPGLMLRPPRSSAAPILSRPLIWRTLWVGGILLLATYAVFEFKKVLGVETASARTAAVNVIVIGEIFYLFGCRSLRLSMFDLGVFSNLWLLGGVAVMLSLQFAFTYTGVMNVLFETEPITWRAWGLAIGTGLLVYAFASVDKWRLRRKEPAQA